MRSPMRGSLMWCSFVSTVCDPLTRRGPRRRCARSLRCAGRGHVRGGMPEHAPRGADRTRRPAARTYRGGRSTRVEAGASLALQHRECRWSPVRISGPAGGRSGVGFRAWGRGGQGAWRSGARPGRVSARSDSQSADGTEHDARAPTESMSGPTQGGAGRQDAGVSGAGGLKGPTDPCRPRLIDSQSAYGTDANSTHAVHERPPKGRGVAKTRGVSSLERSQWRRGVCGAGSQGPTDPSRPRPGPAGLKGPTETRAAPPRASRTQGTHRPEPPQLVDSQSAGWHRARCQKHPRSP